MTDRMRELARRATGAGRLDGASVASGRAEHPVCGDELELDVRIGDGRIADVAWRALGCPATMAVASCLRDAWCGVLVTDSEASLHRTLAALGGLAPHEGHAEKLALRALAAALDGGRR